MDLRSLLGGVVGRHLVQTNRMNFFALGGAGYSRERFFEDPGRNGVESIAGVYHQLFVWGDREAEMTTSLIAFPSLSDPGRLRMEFNTSIRWEIFNDFFWGISAFDSFDSRPPTEATEKKRFRSHYIGGLEVLSPLLRGVAGEAGRGCVFPSSGGVPRSGGVGLIPSSFGGTPRLERLASSLKC